MTTAQFCIMIAIVLYLVLTILIGVYYSRKGSADTADRFYLGGRKLGPIVTAMSAEASDMSSYLLMGLPGLAYLCGLAEVTWTALGLALGTYLNWLIVSRRLRRYSARLNAFTVPGFFSARYRDEKHLLSLTAAIVILIFFVPYTASGFKAVGTLFSSLFGVDYHVAMITGAVVIIGYTVLGGFLAVSATDLIQSIVMTIALLVMLVFGINQAGGLAAVAENAKALPGYLNLTQGYNAAEQSASSFGLLNIISTLAWGLGYFGMPHILLRFMAIRDEKELKTSRRVASVWVVISMAIAVFIGIIGYRISVKGKIPLFTTSSDSETVIVALSDLMSRFGIVFALIAGIVLAGILACTMSTADSQLLAAASSVSQDLLQDFLHIHLSPRAALFAARGTVIGIAVIGICMAWNPTSSVFAIVSFAWAGFGAAFGPAMLLSLFWKRSNRQGTLAGMLAGTAMVFIWKYGIARLGGAFAIYELLPAFLVGLVVIVVVSLITAPPDASVEADFDAVCKKNG